MQRHAVRSLTLLMLVPLMTLVACKNTKKSTSKSGDESAASSASTEALEDLQGDPDVPGVSQVNEDLDKRLMAASKEHGPDYEPRTHHFEDDGTTPTYVNRLILETSPYLLQHAHNPVNWYSWGDAAFERAKAENKPILLSVGYSTCHWCHVMERESFEDEEIAGYINANFIAIKVDREERPDVDSIYMKAVHMLAGRGGWPMTVVMTPDREPFFGGTYFPARTGDRGSRKGFFTILKELKERYESEPDKVVAEAEKVSRRIKASAQSQRPGEVPGPQAIDRAARRLAQSFDPVWGGFGRAPKFPQPVKLEMMLRYHRRTGDEQALEIVSHTLEKMADGGMYDHVGGGFHRYSTDNRWQVPHFEKMLYDNAQLAKVYLEAYQLTDDENFKRVTTEILDYVARDMTDANGGFYSATDADSPTPEGHDEEGYYFTWTPKELEAVLGDERARVVSAYYDVTPRGNFEGRNIFNTPTEAAAVARELGISKEKLHSEVQAAREQLYEARERRPHPIRDEKVITSWNGMMISAFARAALVLDRQDYEERATEAAEFIVAELRDDDGRLMRTHKDGRARHNAYLEDYAFLIDGLLDLFEVSGEVRWLEASIALQETLDEHYWDDQTGGYYTTSHDHEELLAREKPTRDGAEPSGNSVALLNLLRLEEFTFDEAYRKRAEEGFAAFSRNLSRGGVSSTKMLGALDYYLDSPLEILIVEPEGGGDKGPLLARLADAYLPNRVVGVSQEGEPLKKAASILPLLDKKRAIDGETTAYVCEKGHCELPTSDPEVFARQIEKTKPLFENRNAKPLPVIDPDDQPEPWEYDEATNRHWHPGHGHWHQGPPPTGRR